MILLVKEKISIKDIEMEYAPWCPHFEDNCEENNKTTEVKLWKDNAK